MLLLTENSVSDFIVVTLNEKRTIADPYYFFVFEHTTTKAVVTWVVYYDMDFSTYQDRYNEFEINTAEVFEGQAVGQWQYEVWQGSDSETKSKLLENGRMMLQKETPTTFTGHVPITTYVGYGG